MKLTGSTPAVALDGLFLTDPMKPKPHIPHLQANIQLNYRHWATERARVVSSGRGSRGWGWQRGLMEACCFHGDHFDPPLLPETPRAPKVKVNENKEIKISTNFSTPPSEGTIFVTLVTKLGKRPLLSASLSLSLLSSLFFSLSFLLPFSPSHFSLFILSLSPSVF